MTEKCSRCWFTHAESFPLKRLASNENSLQGRSVENVSNLYWDFSQKILERERKKFYSVYRQNVSLHRICRWDRFLFGMTWKSTIRSRNVYIYRFIYSYIYRFIGLYTSIYIGLYIAIYRIDPYTHSSSVVNRYYKTLSLFCNRYWQTIPTCAITTRPQVANIPDPTLSILLSEIYKTNYLL